MYSASNVHTERSLDYLGIFTTGNVFWNLDPVTLVEKTILNGQGKLACNGALSIDTGKFKGRSPEDRFIVKDEITVDLVWWDKQHNLPVEKKVFDALYQKMNAYLSTKEIFVRDAMVCADKRYKKNVRVITEYAWNNLFAYNMFIRPEDLELENFIPEWHVICAPGFSADPETDNVPHPNFTMLNFKEKIVMIGGSGFTGEIKKGIFTILNFLLPLEQNILPMHCAANVGKDNDTALFFGISGTGKTTLSSNADRMLIGDDEHGWSDNTIFNFEGGCYARTINLTRETEPQIYDAIGVGALLENIEFMPDGVTPDYFSSKKTENTRVSFPLQYAPNIMMPSIGSIPKNIFFLSCDAFGVLPPVSKLTIQQAKYYFLNGYSAKIPGSEVNISQPTAVFSACFGAPFLPLHPIKYAEMLKKKMLENNIAVWLINTGWTGGSYGVGERISLTYSRAIMKAILEGELDSARFIPDDIFELAIPEFCPGVPQKLLQPRESWDNKSSYISKAIELKEKFATFYSKYLLPE